MGKLGIANTLTLFRIAAVPALVAAFFIEGTLGEAIRLALFAAAAATDWLDGWTARRRGETSRLGAALDSAADKALVLCALIMLAGTGGLSAAGLVAAALVALREVVVSGLREAMGSEGAALTTERTAKWKTAAQLVALAILVSGSLAAGVHPLLPAVGEALLWVAVLLGLASGTVYARKTLQRLLE